MYLCNTLRFKYFKGLLKGCFSIFPKDKFSHTLKTNICLKITMVKTTANSFLTRKAPLVSEHHQGSDDALTNVKVHPVSLNVFVTVGPDALLDGHVVVHVSGGLFFYKGQCCKICMTAIPLEERKERKRNKTIICIQVCNQVIIS